VAEAAQTLGLTRMLAPERLRRPDAIAADHDLRPGLLVLADYGQIVPRALLDLPHGALNLHPSLLPRHRGASPVPATILAGDPLAGVALMRMDEGLDTGPLVAVRELPLDGTEDAPALEARLAELGAELLAASLAGWLAGELAARPQAETGATLTRPLRRDDGRLDPSRPAVALERQVRALRPWPGSWFEVPSGRFTVLRAGTAASAPDAVPGDLRPAGRGLALITADGALELLEVQPAGGRAMRGEELVRGRPGLLREVVAPPPPSLDPGPIERPVGSSAA
jgi:methionyl-tRNA formyltransferase